MSELTAEDRALLDKLLKNPLLIPDSFRGWLQQFATLYAMPEVEELAGFRTRRFRVADPVTTFELLDSTGIGNNQIDLATVGPLLTGLEDGTYAVFGGMYSKDGTANGRGYAFYYDGVAGFFPDSVVIEGQVMAAHVKVFTGKPAAGHEIRLKYYNLSGNRTSYCGMRWLAAVRVT
jgi:hypothetical protein